MDLTTLLTAESTWRTALNTMTVGRVAMLMDSATLFQALGGGWTPPPLPHSRHDALASNKS